MILNRRTIFGFTVALIAAVPLMGSSCDDDVDCNVGGVIVKAKSTGDCVGKQQVFQANLNRNLQNAAPIRSSSGSGP